MNKICFMNSHTVLLCGSCNKLNEIGNNMFKGDLISAWFCLKPSKQYLLSYFIVLGSKHGSLIIYSIISVMGLSDFILEGGT